MKSRQPRIWDAPLVTELKAFDVFYPAEEYHQEYYSNNPYQPYCQTVVAPKVAKFRQEYRLPVEITGREG